MTPEQFRRWRSAAVRLASTYPSRAKDKFHPSRKWIRNKVASFFEGFDKNWIPVIENWDDSAVYPEGHPYRREQYPHLHLNPPRWGSGPLVCDLTSELEDAWDLPEMPKDMAEKIERLEAKGAAEADEDADEIRQDYCDRWWDPVSACIRAGLGLAVDGGSGAGVLGFTAGDLRKAWPSGVPRYVSNGDERWKYAMSNKLDGTFAKMPDTTKLWL